MAIASLGTGTAAPADRTAALVRRLRRTIHTPPPLAPAAATAA